MVDERKCFDVAGLRFAISFTGQAYGVLGLLPSLRPFAAGESDDDVQDFTISVDDDTRPVSKALRERVRDFDTGNGVTRVDQISGGGYQFIIKDIAGNSCCLLITDPRFARFRCALNGNYNMRCFGLNNALMLAYALCGASRDTVLMHASLVRHNGCGYAFIAKSGTGKSTQVSNWLKYIDNCDLMNDDNPVVRIVGGKAVVFGSPWSGKTPCYRNTSAPLGAITRIDRAKANSVEKMDAVEAFVSLLPAVSTMKWEKSIYDMTCDTIKKIVETTDIYTLHCLPDRESAEICSQTIKKA